MEPFVKDSAPVSEVLETKDSELPDIKRGAFLV